MDGAEFESHSDFNQKPSQKPIATLGYTQVLWDSRDYGTSILINMELSS